MQTRGAPTEQSAEISPKAQERKQFREAGFIGPYTLCTADEMAGYRTRIEQEVLGGDRQPG